MKHNLNIFTPRENRKISFKQKNLYLNTQFVINPLIINIHLTLQDNHDIHKKVKMAINQKAAILFSKETNDGFSVKCRKIHTTLFTSLHIFLLMCNDKNDQLYLF